MLSGTTPFVTMTFFFFGNRFLQTTPHQLQNRSVSDPDKLINSNKALSCKKLLETTSFPLGRTLCTACPGGSDNSSSSTERFQCLSS